MTKRSDIAQALGVSRPAVTRWAARGMPVYSVEAARAWHSAHIRTRRKRHDMARPAAGGDDVGALSWRERLDRARAMREETLLAQQQGALLPVADVLTARVRQMTAFRARMLAVPTAFCARFVAPDRLAEAFEVLTSMIAEGLDELAGSDGE